MCPSGRDADSMWTLPSVAACQPEVDAQAGQAAEFGDRVDESSKDTVAEDDSGTRSGWSGSWGRRAGQSVQSLLESDPLGGTPRARAHPALRSACCRCAASGTRPWTRPVVRSLHLHLILAGAAACFVLSRFEAHRHPGNCTVVRLGRLRRERSDIARSAAERMPCTHPVPDLCYRSAGHGHRPDMARMGPAPGLRLRVCPPGAEHGDGSPNRGEATRERGRMEGRARRSSRKSSAGRTTGTT